MSWKICDVSFWNSFQKWIMSGQLLKIFYLTKFEILNIFFVYVSTQPISCQWSKPVFWYFQRNIDAKLVKKAALDIMMFYRLTRGLKTLLYVFTKKVWIVDEKNAAKSWKLTHGLMERIFIIWMDIKF